MNILDINISDSLPYVVDAFANVYGEEYRDVITDRIYNKTYFFTYNNIDGISDYLYFLRSCKARELSIEFLEEIGIDVSKYKDISYAQDFDESLEKLISQYIGSYRGMTPGYIRLFPKGIKAWLPFDEEKINIEEIELQKINFINFLEQGALERTITKENFKDFCKTNEYEQILKKIEKYLQVFNEISKKYGEFLEEIQPYQNYVDQEAARKVELENQKRNQLYYQIEGSLPDELRFYLDSKYSTIDEKSRAVFGYNLGSKSFLEYFSSKDENKLLDPLISENEKNRIYRNRSYYFVVQLMAVQSSSNANDREFYEECIQQDNIKKLILPAEVVDKIKELKTKAYEELQRDFIWSSEEFLEKVKIFGNNQNSKEEVYKCIKEQSVCIIPCDIDEDNLMNFLFFTIRKDGGALDYIILHELGHSIETRKIPRRWV